MDKIPITKEGLERLREQLGHLVEVDRPENIRAIEEALGHGDIAENAEYHAAKERQSYLEAKINELKIAINNSEVIENETGSPERVVFGRTVVLYHPESDEESSFRLVGPYEADPERGTISVKSPLGLALIGREEGDEVKVQTPKGLQQYEVVKIK